MGVRCDRRKLEGIKGGGDTCSIAAASYNGRVGWRRTSVHCTDASLGTNLMVWARGSGRVL
jgi:hypothetical protein